jgi:hypothetical protein
MSKTSEFCSEPFLDEKKPQNSVLNHFQKRKNLGVPFRITFRREKNFGKTTFVSSFVKLHWNTVPSRFVSGCTLFCGIRETVFLSKIHQVGKTPLG